MSNKKFMKSVRTWDVELRANLARALALERSTRSRKKGRASLEETKRTFQSSDHNNVLLVNKFTPK